MINIYLLKNRKIFIIIYVILTISCSKDKAKNEITASYSAWIEYKNAEAGFELKIPKIWEKLSKQEFKMFKDKLKNSSEKEIVPLEVYINKSKGNSCLISKLVQKKNIQNVVKEYKKRFKKNLPDAKVEFSNFTNNGIKFYQFKVITKYFINLKLLFSAKEDNIIQIDYTVSKSFYKKFFNSIRLSIETIKK